MTQQLARGVVLHYFNPKLKSVIHHYFCIIESSPDVIFTCQRLPIPPTGRAQRKTKNENMPGMQTMDNSLDWTRERHSFSFQDSDFFREENYWSKNCCKDVCLPGREENGAPDQRGPEGRHFDHRELGTKFTLGRSPQECVEWHKESEQRSCTESGVYSTQPSLACKSKLVKLPHPNMTLTWGYAENIRDEK